MWCKQVVRELENDQHVSLEADVFRFPFIFFNLSGLGLQVFSGGYLRLLPWHYNDIQYQNNIVYYYNYKVYY